MTKDLQTGEIKGAPVLGPELKTVLESKFYFLIYFGSQFYLKTQEICAYTYSNSRKMNYFLLPLPDYR